MHHRLAFPLLPVLALAAAASAGSLKPDRVAADAEWLLHVDMEALVESTLGQYIIEHEDEFDLELDDIREEVGVDPVRDIFGITVYGKGDPEEEDATVVLEMSETIDDVVEAASGEDEYERIEVKGYTLHRWDDGDRTYVHIVKKGDRRIVVLSGRKVHVVDAARVLDGKSPSLEDAMEREDDGISEMPRKGSLIFGYAMGLPWLVDDDDDPASVIVQRSNRIKFEVRERASTTSLDLVISAKSGDDARNISEVMTGLVALGKLLSGSDPSLDEASKFLEAIEIKSKKNDIKVRLEGDSEELVRHLHAFLEHVDLD